MLAIVPIEIRLGRPQSSQWFRDSKESIVLQQAGFRLQPSRASVQFRRSHCALARISA
jgi:hypothetical protein